MPVSNRTSIVLFVLFVGAFLGAQVWMSWEIKRRSEAVMETIHSLQAAQFPEEKVRQEIAALRIENEKKTIFLQTFIANFSTAVSVIIALLGAWIGFQQYVGVRHKEQVDQTAKEMNQLWEGITSSDNRVRAGSIAGLRHFLSPEKAEFHDRVASALALAGRLDNDEVVLKTLKPVIESAMKEIPEAMKAVSWQGLKLRGHRTSPGATSRVSISETACWRRPTSAGRRSRPRASTPPASTRRNSRTPN